MNEQDKQLLNKLALAGATLKYDKKNTLTKISLTSDISMCKLPSFTDGISLIPDGKHSLDTLSVPPNVDEICLNSVRIKQILLTVHTFTEYTLVGLYENINPPVVSAHLDGGIFHLTLDAKSSDASFTLKLTGQGCVFISIRGAKRLNIIADLGVVFSINYVFFIDEFNVNFNAAKSKADLVSHAFMLCRSEIGAGNAKKITYANQEDKVLASALLDALLNQNSSPFPIVNNTIDIPFKVIDGRSLCLVLRHHAKASNNKSDLLTIKAPKIVFNTAHMSSENAIHLGTLQIIGDVSHLDLDAFSRIIRAKKLIIKGNVGVICRSKRTTVDALTALEFVHISGNVDTIESYAFPKNQVLRTYIGGDVNTIKPNALINTLPKTNNEESIPFPVLKRYFAIQGNVNSMRTLGGVTRKDALERTEWNIGIGGNVTLHTAIVGGATLDNVHIGGILTYKNQLLSGQVGGSFLFDLGGKSLRKNSITTSSYYLNMRLYNVSSINAGAIVPKCASDGIITILGVETLRGAFISYLNIANLHTLAIVSEDHLKECQETIRCNSKTRNALCVIIVAKGKVVNANKLGREFLERPDITSKLDVRGIDFKYLDR